MTPSKTGNPCTCRRGIGRDNCPNCEGTGWVIDWRKWHSEQKTEKQNQEVSVRVIEKWIGIQGRVK